MRVSAGDVGLVVGTCEITDVVGPLSLDAFQTNARKAGLISTEVKSLPYEKYKAVAARCIRIVI